MNIQKTISKMLARNLRQHQQAAERAVRFDAGLVANDLEGLIIEVKPTIEILRRDLTLHFQREDEWFFPAVLMANPDYDLIQKVLALEEEHGRLRIELDHLIDGLDEATRETEFIARADLDRLHDYLKALKAHAAREMAYIFGRFEQPGPALNALGTCIQENPPGDEHTNT